MHDFSHALRRLTGVKASARARATLHAAAAILAYVAGAGCADAATTGGVAISNAASATYADGLGRSYATVSNTVTTTVQAVGAIIVTPKRTACSPQDVFGAGQPLTRTFLLKNGGNASDAYVLASASASAGKIVSLVFTTADGTVVQAAVGATSPSVAPGGTLGVRVTLSTADVAPGTDLTLQVGLRSTAATANGPSMDLGVECVRAAVAPTFSGLGGVNTPIRKLIDGATSRQSAPGATVTYTVGFQNAGALPATNGVFSDVVPPTLTPNPASVKYDGVDVSDRARFASGVLSVPLGTVAPNVPHVVSFDALVGAGTPVGTAAVNVATLRADGIAEISTTPASVFIGIANVVYDGYVGAPKPIAGATVTIRDPSNPSVPLATNGVPIAPNGANGNPYVTGADGTYAFGLGTAQIVSKSYDLTITAAGYLNRRISLQIAPDPTHTIYDVTLLSVDGQPLAKPGGFSLVGDAAAISTSAAPSLAGRRVFSVSGPQVIVPKVYGLFGNLPMFRAQPLQITKTVDRSFASSGDRLVYTIKASATGAGTVPFGATAIADQLPPQLAYAPGTARADGVPLEPTRVGRVLTWNFPDFATPHTIVFATVVQQSLDPHTVVTNDATVTAAVPNNPAVFAAAAASVDVQITSGVFTIQTVMTGRVFLDRRATGRFAPGDVGLGGVRIYRENGESVRTDAQGRFDFPGVSPGMHVLRLDETTLPRGTRAYGTHAYDDERSTRRLVHGVFDGGLIQDVNFAIEGAP